MKDTLACRMHRIVDASIFYLSAREAVSQYSDPGLAALISMTSRWAAAMQITAMAITLFFPKFSAHNHEALKASFLPLRPPWRSPQVP